MLGMSLLTALVIQWGGIATLNVGLDSEKTFKEISRKDFTISAKQAEHLHPTPADLLMQYGK